MIRLWKKHPNILMEIISYGIFSLTPESRRPNSRLVNTKTFIRNNSWKESRVEPVWIDIFPLDGLPESSVLSTIHKIRLLFRKDVDWFCKL